MKLLTRCIFIILLFIFANEKIKGQCLDCDTETYTIKLGYSNTINQLNNYQTLIGNNNTISGGVQNYAIGGYNTVSGTQSMSLGAFSEALGTTSFSLGNYLISQNTGSFVIGLGISPSQKLTNNVQSSLMIGFNSAFPTIFVGQTPVGYQSGRVGIGNITSPEAKLHIRADAGEDASLLLEATSNDNMSRLMLGNNHHIVAGHQSHMRFETASNKGFVLSNGNLGIYSEDPKASVHIQQGDIYIEDIHSGIIMKSPNGQCWRGRLSDNGNLSFEQTDCPEEATAAVSHLPQQDRLRLYPNPTGSSITIETDLHGLYAEVLISTLDGKPISRQQIGSNRMDISLDHFVAGMYLVSLELNRQVVETHKVIKH
jgi:hypothetical protein